MNMIWVSLGTAVALGATSSVHCAAMCGPLAAVGTAVQGKVDTSRALRYLGGRLSGYSVLGALAGFMAAPLTAGQTGEVVRLVLAIVVAVLLVYRALGLVRPAIGEQLVRLGRNPARLGFFRTLMRHVPRHGFGLGLATALFPCGALWAGLFTAASSGSAWLGAAMMALFAAASAPLLLLPAIAATAMGHHLRHAWMRRIGAIVLIGAAVWVLVPPIRSFLAPTDKPVCCEHGSGA